jgi:hypothetical protein
MAGPKGPMWMPSQVPLMRRICPLPCQLGQTCYDASQKGHYQCQLMPDGSNNWVYYPPELDPPLIGFLESIFGYHADCTTNTPLTVTSSTPYSVAQNSTPLLRGCPN